MGTLDGLTGLNRARGNLLITTGLSILNSNQSDWRAHGCVHREGADLSEGPTSAGVKGQTVRGTCLMGCVPLFRDPDPCVHEWTNRPMGKAKWLGWQRPENRKGTVSNWK